MVVGVKSNVILLEFEGCVKYLQLDTQIISLSSVRQDKQRDSS